MTDQQFLDLISAEGYNVETDLAYPTNDNDIPAYEAKVAEYVAHAEELNKRSDLPCIVACIVAYVICVGQNPGMSQSICQAAYQNCLGACNVTAE